jgi:phage shock protein PspC (stress-responsive transcriptional regulator)
MLVAADQALGQTLALLATFVGIGVLVNLLIFYIVAQVMAERKQNQEANRGTQEVVPVAS